MAESSTEHKDLLMLQSLVALTRQINTLPEIALLLQQFLSIRPIQLRARHLLRSIEIILYEQTSRLTHSVTHLKAQTILARASTARTPQEKMTMIEDALALEPLSVKGNTMLAQAAREMHLLSVAAFAYEIVCQQEPNTRKNWHELGLLYEHTKDWIEARSVYHEILQTDPDDLVAKDGMQRVVQELMQTPPEASESSPPASAEGPELTEIQAKEMAGRIEQLKGQLERYQRPGGQPTLTQIQPGQAKERETTISRLSSEIQSLSLQIARHKARQAPQDLNLQFQLAQALEESDFLAQAMAGFEKLKEVEAHREQAMVRLGCCYVKEALQQLMRRRKAATDDPDLQAAPESFPGEYSHPEQANWF